MKGMIDNRRAYVHFSNVASSYDELRQTDLEPILTIKELLQDEYNIKAVDIGCGTGRYSLLLQKHLNILHLTCIDCNESMLEQANKSLMSYGVCNFTLLKSFAEHTPLEDNSVDYAFTFNAIHHFKLTSFLLEAARFVKSGGKIFIYTRLRSQNAKNIWGIHFPMFLEKEKRLYEIDEVEQMIKPVQTLVLQDIKYFSFHRCGSLKRLVNMAENSHYSTFYLYSKAEFKSALQQFQNNVRQCFENIDQVEWSDEYTLFIIERV